MIPLQSKRRSVALASLVVLVLGAAAAGCEKKDDDEKSDASATPAAPAAPPPPATPPPAAPPPATPPPAAPAGDVTRYPDEQPLSGGATISNDVAARKQANANSELVQNLAHGSGVTKVARSGNWTLVSWKQAAGDKMGWVETSKAFTNNDDPDVRRTIPKAVLDEGKRRGVLR